MSIKAPPPTRRTVGVNPNTSTFITGRSKQRKSRSKSRSILKSPDIQPSNARPRRTVGNRDHARMLHEQCFTPVKATPKRDRIRKTNVEQTSKEAPKVVTKPRRFSTRLNQSRLADTIDEPKMKKSKLLENNKNELITLNLPRPSGRASKIPIAKHGSKIGSRSKNSSINEFIPDGLSPIITKTNKKSDKGEENDTNRKTKRKIPAEKVLEHFQPNPPPAPSSFKPLLLRSKPSVDGFKMPKSKKRPQLAPPSSKRMSISQSILSNSTILQRNRLSTSIFLKRIQGYVIISKSMDGHFFPF